MLLNRLPNRHMRPGRLCTTLAGVGLFLQLGLGLAWGQVSINLGQLDANKSIRVSYTTTVVAMPGTDPISNQGTVTGGNFSPVLTDDPDTLALDDPTVTQNVVPVELQRFTIE